jgi:hypothetical protein
VILLGDPRKVLFRDVTEFSAPTGAFVVADKPSENRSATDLRLKIR